MVKVRADKLDLKIRALHPANPVYRVAVVVEPWDGRDPPADST